MLTSIFTKAFNFLNYVKRKNIVLFVPQSPCYQKKIKEKSKPQWPPCNGLRDLCARILSEAKLSLIKNNNTESPCKRKRKKKSQCSK